MSACVYTEPFLLPPNVAVYVLSECPAVNPCSLVSHQPDVLHIIFAEDCIPMNTTALHRWQSLHAGCCCYVGGLAVGPDNTFRTCQRNCSPGLTLRITKPANITLLA